MQRPSLFTAAIHDPVRVCLVIDRLEMAGGPRFFELLLRGLDSRRFALTIATDPGSPLLPLFQQLGAGVETIPFSRRVDLGTLRALRRLIHREKFDVVHSMGLRADFYAALAGALSKTRTKLISTVAFLAQDYYVGPVRRTVYRAAESWAQSRAAALITDSENTRRRLLARRLSAERVRTIYFGTDPAAFDPQKADGRRVRQELGLGPGPVAASVGRLAVEKGHGYFLDALAALSRKRPDIQALIVGDGPLAANLKAGARDRGLDRLLRFLPARQDVVDLLAAVDVLVIASVLESLPFILYEAMAMARPLVVTAVGGIPEVVQDGKEAFVVPPADAPALAEALGRMLEDPARAAEMGRRARAAIQDRFKVQNMVDAVARCYQDIVFAGKDGFPQGATI